MGFYGNRDLAEPVIVRRIDAEISFNWGYSSPAPGVPPDNFSVRWTRTLGLPGGTYRVTARSDDGVRVYIDSVLVIDDWQVQSATTCQPGCHSGIIRCPDSRGGVFRRQWCGRNPGNDPVGIIALCASHRVPFR